MKDRISDRIEYLQPDEEEKKALIDLSASGAAFNYPVAEKKDEKIHIKIKDHIIDAVVVYSQANYGGYRIGVQFKNLDSPVQKEIKKWVDEFSRGVPLTCEIVRKDRNGKA